RARRAPRAPCAARRVVGEGHRLPPAGRAEVRSALGASGGRGLLRAGLDALQHLPGNRATRELAIDLRLELRPSLFSLGRVESAIDHLNTAAALAQELDDPRRVGATSGAVSACLWWTGSYERAVAAGERARTIAEQCDDFGLRIVANSRLGYAHSDLGHYQRA